MLCRRPQGNHARSWDKNLDEVPATLNGGYSLPALPRRTWAQEFCIRLTLGPEMTADLGNEFEVGKGVIQRGLVGRTVNDAV
jgi:hypothetical protein